MRRAQAGWNCGGLRSLGSDAIVGAKCGGWSGRGFVARRAAVGRLTVMPLCSLFSAVVLKDACGDQAGRVLS